MGRLSRVLVLAAFVVPVVAYVAGSLAVPGGPEPVDRGPVILHDRPSPTSTSTPATEPTPDPRPGPSPSDDRIERHGDARVVTPLPTPVGEDEAGERDDDGPDDDDSDTDERRDQERDDDERDDD
jgi:hypothetical protein